MFCGLDEGDEAMVVWDEQKHLTCSECVCVFVVLCVSLRCSDGPAAVRASSLLTVVLPNIVFHTDLDVFSFFFIYG